MQFSHAITYYEIYLGKRALSPDEQPDEEMRSYIDIDTNVVRLSNVYSLTIIDTFTYLPLYVLFFSG